MVGEENWGKDDRPLTYSLEPKLLGKPAETRTKKGSCVSFKERQHLNDLQQETAAG